jgi:hypothetical protein
VEIIFGGRVPLVGFFSEVDGVHGGFLVGKRQCMDFRRRESYKKRRGGDGIRVTNPKRT